MERRTIKITLEQAKELYNSDNAVLRKIALQAYTEKECIGFDYSNIKTFGDALDCIFDKRTSGNITSIERIISSIKSF